MDTPITVNNSLLPNTFTVTEGGKDVQKTEYPIYPPAGLRRKTGVIVGDDVRKLFEYARREQFAIPAINVTSTSSIVAALQAAQQAQSPIILQVSSGGAAFFAGNKGLQIGGRALLETAADVMIRGSIGAAHFIRSVAPSYGIPVVLHTDHCHAEELPWLDGLLTADIEYSEAYQARLKAMISPRVELIKRAKAILDVWKPKVDPAWEKYKPLKAAVDSADKALKDAKDQKADESVITTKKKALEDAQKAAKPAKRDFEEADQNVFEAARTISAAEEGIKAIEEEIKAGLKEPLFSSHMIDLSEQPHDHNIRQTKDRLERSKEAGTWLEMEIGITGGEEDGTNNENASRDKLYTNPEDIWAVYDGLRGVSENFSIAAAFGNVHGLYKPGAVKLRPWLLGKHQKYTKAKLANPNADVPGAVVPNHPEDMNPEEVDLEEDPATRNPVFFVFHGGSGSDKKDFLTGIKHGVVKVNIDTDTQFTYTKPVRDWMVKWADRLEQPVGCKANPNDNEPNKKKFDPRNWLREAETGMRKRVIEALEDFNAAGKWTVTWADKATVNK